MSFVSAARSLLLPFVLLASSTSLSAQVGVPVNIAPPELPMYDQPFFPRENCRGIIPQNEDDFHAQGG